MKKHFRALEQCGEFQLVNLVCIVQWVPMKLFTREVSIRQHQKEWVSFQSRTCTVCASIQPLIRVGCQPVNVDPPGSSWSVYIYYPKAWIMIRACSARISIDTSSRDRCNFLSMTSLRLCVTVFYCSSSSEQMDVDQGWNICHVLTWFSLSFQVRGANADADEKEERAVQWWFQPQLEAIFLAQTILIDALTRHGKPTNASWIHLMLNKDGEGFGTKTGN